MRDPAHASISGGTVKAKLAEKATGLVLLMAALFGLLSVVVPATAAAESQPTCKGAECDGLDPSKTNCVEDARTILSRHARTPLTGEDIGHLELRYSPRCHSNWVRFTPWYGVRTLLANGTAKAGSDGTPWIWRQGVANSLRGKVGASSIADVRAVTSWTAMVTADGVTCSSVGLYQTGHSTSGQGGRDSLGSYDAPCIS